MLQQVYLIFADNVARSEIIKRSKWVNGLCENRNKIKICNIVKLILFNKVTKFSLASS